MPTRLARALLKETTGLYLLGVATICLLLSIDMLSVLARFLVQQGATLAEAGMLLFYKLPWFLHLAIPVAVVFAVLLACGRMAKDSELKAAYSLGVTPPSLLWPIIGFGVVVGLIGFVNNGFVEARAEAAYQRRIDAFLYVKPPNELQLDAAYRLPGGVYYAARTRSQAVNNDRADLSGVLVVLDDGTTITAASGEWDSSRRVWRLVSAERTSPGGSPEPLGSLELPFELEASAQETLARPAELPIDQLWRQLRQVSRAGGDVREMTYDLHRRVADALSAAFFAAFAGSIALRVGGRESGFAWTMVLMVLFWALWVLSGNLFASGALGPVVAAWLTPAAAAVGATLLAARSLTR